MQAENPSESAVDSLLRTDGHTDPQSDSAHFQNLAVQILHNLRHQHDWVELSTCTHSVTEPRRLLPRPVLSGLPPRRLYLHPDEQIELIKQNVAEADIPPEREWVLPTHIKEKWTLRKFAEIFDCLTAVPPVLETQNNSAETHANKWRTTKRLLLATMHEDSTVVYYVVHDGIVKPRQN